MQYSRKASLKWILIYLVIGILAYVAIHYLFLNKDSKYIYSQQNEQTQNSNLASNDFTFKIGDSYADTKVKLMVTGWLSVSQSSNPIDPLLPEIGNCGSGVDAICNVDFQKGVFKNHLNVQSKQINGKLEWIVVGNQ